MLSRYSNSVKMQQFYLNVKKVMNVLYIITHVYQIS